ncbi:MAG: phosphatase PAP2 family protein [Acidobacteria bacterium]|nr:phosphatase PAP2 family protein [Acidobacteriota bacterium]
MSIAGAEKSEAEVVDGRATAEPSGESVALLAISIWFFATIVLSAFWPAPAIAINDALFGAEIVVDEHSFFGREPLQWDALMWFLIGLPFIVVLHGRTRHAAETFRRFRSEMTGWWPRVKARVRHIGVARFLVVFVSGCGLLALVWAIGDAFIVAWLSSVPERLSNFATRPLNRLGDGLLMTVCVLFIGVAGAAFGRLRWMFEAVAIAITASVSGVLLSTLKPVVGRVRPELWTSPFDFAPGGDSFPSGHSLYAAAFGVTLLLARVHGRLRWILAGFVMLIPLARIVNFRHWPSDALGSILLVCLVAWIVVPATMQGKAIENAPTLSE